MPRRATRQRYIIPDIQSAKLQTRKKATLATIEDRTDRERNAVSTIAAFNRFQNVYDNKRCTGAQLLNVKVGMPSAVIAEKTQRYE